MVYTLQRYVFKELFRVFALSTFAFTLILSLGSVLQPIQEFGASPGQVIRLLSCFLPVTLTFVLPVAAIFASALIYGRFANDNELDACRASGISLITLVYPGLFLAVIVSICTLVLSFHVMPHFIMKAEKVIKADAKQICFRNIQRKGYYDIPGKRFRIKADLADSEHDQLMGVVIVESKKNKMRKTIEADSANIRIEPYDGFNELSIVATNVYQTDPEGEQVYSEKLPLKYRFSSLLGDNIRFKKLSEIKKIKTNPVDFYPVQKQVDQAYAQLVMEILAADINRAFNYDLGGNYYRQLSSENKRLVFTAQQCIVNKNGSLEIVGNISFIENDINNEEISNWQCNKAIIQMETDIDTSSFVMTLHDAVKTEDSGQVQLRFRPFFRGIKLPNSVTDMLPESKLEAIENLLKPNQNILKKPSSKLMGLAKETQRKIHRTGVQITSEINSRLVFGLGCIVLILISIGLGIFYKGGHLLVAFAISMIPAAFLIVCMMAGKNMAKSASADSTDMGVLIMWSGLIVLIGLTGYIFRKLMRM